MLRRVPRTTSVGFVAAAVALIVSSATGAYTVSSSTGRPGVVKAKRILGSNPGAPSTQSVRWPGGTIYRSPAAADRLQFVCARYRIYDWNYTYGKWYVWAIAPQGRETCVSVSRGEHVNMASIPSTGGTDFGRYRGVWKIAWYANLPAYRQIASVTLDFRDAGDYSCLTSACQVFYSDPSDRYYLFFPG